MCEELNLKKSPVENSLIIFPYKKSFSPNYLFSLPSDKEKLKRGYLSSYFANEQPAKLHLHPFK